MAETKKITITNVSGGPKGINAVGGLVMIDTGKSEEVEISQGEADDLPDYFEAGGAVSEPGPLDQSVEDLIAHLATVDDPDKVQRLIDGETAGKSRKGALAALEARRDELLEA